MDALFTLVSKTLAQPVQPGVQVMADQITGQCKSVQAILTYGSTLRGTALDDTLIDYFVVVNTYADYAGGSFSRWCAKLAPPNVYFTEASHNQSTLRAKFAVVTVGDLWHRVRPSETNPYFWVRLCQPMALVFASDETAKQQATLIICDAMRTAYSCAAGLRPQGSPQEKWLALFEKTYFTELRPEKSDRAAQIVETQLSHFEAIAECLPDIVPLTADWPSVTRRGKYLTLLRLAKAAFTFSGGPDYVAWKIERHTGEKISLSPWQRRHPLLTGLVLLPKLLRRGLVR